MAETVETWFVIMRGHDGKPLPFVDDNDVLATFLTETEADNAASRNPMGVVYGWEAYQWK